MQNRNHVSVVTETDTNHSLETEEKEKDVGNVREVEDLGVGNATAKA
jgi:hypothetical protein